MNLPFRPLSSNFTKPSISENNVSSLPIPTFLPGFHLVPRCRARMFPPRTRSPPNFLSPKRCEFESRPFREEPTPFLCAISKLLRFPQSKHSTPINQARISVKGRHSSRLIQFLTWCSPDDGPVCAYIAC